MLARISLTEALILLVVVGVVLAIGLRAGRGSGGRGGGGLGGGGLGGG